MIDLSRILNVASALLFITGITGIIYGLQELFLVAYLDEELLGVTASEISAQPKSAGFYETRFPI